MESKAQNIPALRFSEFSGEWKQNLFGSLYFFHATNSLSREDLQEAKAAWMNIHYGDIHTNYNSKFFCEEEKIPFIKENSQKKIKVKNFVKLGDLVFADASEDLTDIGKMIEIMDVGDRQILAGLHTIHAVPRKKHVFFSGFASDLFKSVKIRRQIAKNSQGAKVLGLSSKKLSAVSIDFPEFQEQKKIASFLSATDRKILQLIRKIYSLEKYKKGCMQKIFLQKIRFQNSQGKVFSGYTKAVLGHLAKISTGNSNREDSTEIGDYVFFDRSNDIRASSKYLFDCEAIIVAGEGKDFPPRHYKGKFDLHQRAYAVTDFGENNARFLYYWIYWKRAFFLKYSVGSTMPSLRMNCFEKFPVNLIDPAEQKKIADFLSAIDRKIDLVSAQLNMAEAFKKGLLQQMFV